jgi:short-subunit dehydrogenase
LLAPRIGRSFVAAEDDMRHQLKPVSQQTIVLTGATSGIGLATARMAAHRGARLVLAARDEDGLRRLEQDLRANGAEVAVVAADVARRDDIHRIAQTAIDRFGGFDTWVNDAGLSIYGRLEGISEEDSRRLFDVNFWGMVNGSLEAVRHLKERGGAIVNLGSIASDISIPLQGMYCASKHAIKAFTETLRMELENERAPIGVTLIKPGAIDTPFPEHARNYTEARPKLPPPVYPPEDVARAILHAAEQPRREIFVGGGGKFMTVQYALAPRLFERVMSLVGFPMQLRRDGARGRRGSLDEARGGLRERGDYPGHVARTSLYTRAALHPWLTTAVVGAAGLAVAGVVARARA